MLGAACLRGARPAPVDAAVRAARGDRRVGARRPYRVDRAQPSAVRLPHGVRAPSDRRLARKPQARARAVPSRRSARAAENPRKRRLGVSANGIERRKAIHRNDVWCWDFVEDSDFLGLPLRFLTLVDEYTRECLLLEVER
jgi:hypothetical protein